MNKDTITIDGVEYVRKQPLDKPIKIVVLDKGFVYVGKFEIQDGFVVITDAKNIRRWGTTKGLGELVNGPTPSTVLDNVGVVRAPVRSLVLTIEVEQDKWSR